MSRTAHFTALGLASFGLLSTSLIQSPAIADHHRSDRYREVSGSSCLHDHHGRECKSRTSLDVEEWNDHGSSGWRVVELNADVDFFQKRDDHGWNDNRDNRWNDNRDNRDNRWNDNRDHKWKDRRDNRDEHNGTHDRCKRQDRQQTDSTDRNRSYGKTGGCDANWQDKNNQNGGSQDWRKNRRDNNGSYGGQQNQDSSTHTTTDPAAQPGTTDQPGSTNQPSTNTTNQPGTNTTTGTTPDASTPPTQPGSQSTNQCTPNDNANPNATCTPNGNQGGNNAAAGSTRGFSVTFRHRHHGDDLGEIRFQYWDDHRDEWRTFATEDVDRHGRADVKVKIKIKSHDEVIVRAKYSGVEDEIKGSTSDEEQID